MYKRILITLYIVSCIFTGITQAQSEQTKLYDPAANALKDLSASISKAKEENKHVLVQVGGNWCKWCLRVDKFIKDNPEIDSQIKADYIFIRVNYSKENKNQEALKLLEYPQRFGFPVFVVLDSDGKRIHTQNSWYLEEGEGYSVKKFKSFLTNWNRSALNPQNY